MPSNTTLSNRHWSPNPELILRVQTLTEQPGVYRMLDDRGNIIYVGKAINLKKRVSQYFQKNQTHPKTQALVRHIYSIDVTVTQNETEALLLESHLIKTHQPKYNILLRDDKSYPYLFIDIEHPFPSLTIYRSKHKPQHGLAFGPFPNAYAINETIQFLQKCFKIRSCRNNQFAHRTRPCLQYEIKRCDAPCTGYISQEDYKKSLQNCIQFLSGESNQLQEKLIQQMDIAVKNLSFEQAAYLRDLLQQLRQLQTKQSIIHDAQDCDIIVIQAFAPYALEHVEVRQGNILKHKAYFPPLNNSLLGDTETNPDEIWQMIFDAFFREHYFEQPENIPYKIITQKNLTPVLCNSYSQIFKSIAQHECRVTTDVSGINQGWLEFALNNLKLHIEQKYKPLIRLQQRWDALEYELKLLNLIQRIQCFDVSHHQGQATIASCVSFNKEGKEKSLYRTYSIQNAKAGDDYQALHEALTRHIKAFKASPEYYPDLILIDGGKGQVNIAQEVLQEQSMAHIPVLGICKGERRRACFDRIFNAQTKAFFSWEDNHPALHLLQEIRDEAHRFAIQASRKKRTITMLTSDLESIEGIGPIKRKRLLQHFGGLQELKKATYDELIQVPGISPILAQRVIKSFK